MWVQSDGIGDAFGASTMRQPRLPHSMVLGHLAADLNRVGLARLAGPEVPATSRPVPRRPEVPATSQARKPASPLSSFTNSRRDEPVLGADLTRGVESLAGVPEIYPVHYETLTEDDL